jgi:hypothetical protein
MWLLHPQLSSETPTVDFRPFGPLLGRLRLVRSWDAPPSQLRHELGGKRTVGWYQDAWLKRSSTLSTTLAV